ncbi:DUF6603 domain-containing protein [Amycolatopsis panacis]|uniref:DUF6603 domain-containing protein n=1 Tax=Amycolatopsis panacis TaxID=2340917 RepID=A0A419I259_9PSEU|nr:DUF6603 domain-containing protein [Amycolatopsis panacis]RJQ83881.1 hypothetical protein D5S19_18930 [Amycolatopsis panacis]
MPLRVTDLRAKLAAADSLLEFSPEFLQLVPAVELFTRFLGDALLNVRVLSVDVDALMVEGTVTIIGQAASTARIVFQTDDAEEHVLGLRVDVVLLDDGPGLPPEIADIPAVLAMLGLGPLHLVFGIEPTGDGPASARPRVGLGIELLFPRPDTSPRPYVWAYPPWGSGQPWYFFGSFDKVRLNGLDDLLKLAAGDFDLPDDLGTGELALNALAFDVVPADSTSAVDLRWLSLGVGIGLAGRWDALPGVLAVEDLDAAFTVADPLGRPEVAVVLGGRVRLGEDILVDVTVMLPGRSLYGVLARPVELGSLLEDLFGNIPLFGDLVVSRLAVSAEMGGEPSYALELDLDNVWTIVEGIALSSVDLRVVKEGGTVSATVGAVWQVGDGAFHVLGAWAAGGDWSFTATAEAIELSEVLDSLGIQPPDVLSGMAFDRLAITFDSAGHVSVACEARFELDEKLSLLTVTFDAERGGQSRNLGVLLAVPVDTSAGVERILEFRGEFSAGPSGKTVTVAWTGSPGIGAAELARGFGLELPSDAPASLLPSLASIGLRRDLGSGRTVLAAATVSGNGIVLGLVPDAGRTRKVFLAGYGLGWSLSDLPLIGGGIPTDADFGVDAIAITAADAPITAVQRGLVDADLAVLEMFTGTVFPRLPALTQDGSLARGVYLSLACVLGGEPFAMPAVPLTGGAPPRATLPAASRDQVPLAVRDLSAPDAPSARSDVGHSFGPLFLRSVDIGFDRGAALLNLDAELGAGGLTLAVQGLALGVDLDDLAFTWKLSGLSAEFDRPPLRISGTLVNKTLPARQGDDLMLAGVLIVQMPQFGVTALGAYLRKTGAKPSLFVFGRGQAALGGPPIFRVTAVNAGFGYNSHIDLPDAGGVESFPFVTGITGDLLTVLDKLTGRWVTPRDGAIWLAAGLDFTSFRLVLGRLMLFLEIGDGLTLGLLGTARAALPPTDTALAEVNLAISVLFRSAVGEFRATAQLYDSFIIDPACALTGGFAFIQWFDPHPRAGDFVLTLGGYHSLFEKPDHFPAVPRLGFRWSMGAVDITGTAFFAMAPSAIMAGGTLDVRYKSGPLEAWLTAYAHVHARWKPLCFEAGFGVTVGAKLKLLITFRGELGAELAIWGPPTGGTVTAKFVFVKVTIDFGRGRKQPATIDWQQFAELLPPSEKALRITVPDGLLADTEPPAGRLDEDGKDDKEGSERLPWLIDSAGATFRIDTAVPASSTAFQDRPADGDTPLDIRPLGRTGIDSPLRVRVARKPAAGDTSSWQPLADDGDWVDSPILGNVPTSLWGTPGGNPFSADERLLRGRRTGMQVVIPPPVSTGTPLPRIKDSSIAYEELDPADNPLDPAGRPAGDGARQAAGAVGVVAATITTTATARTRLHSALGTLLTPSGFGSLPDDSLTGLETHLNDSGLGAAPLLLTSSGSDV